MGIAGLHNLHNLSPILDILGLPLKPRLWKPRRSRVGAISSTYQP